MLYALLESIDLYNVTEACYMWLAGYKSINKTLKGLLWRSKLDRYVETKI